MLNVKNIRTKQPSKKLSLKLYGPFKIIKAKKDSALSNLKYRLQGVTRAPYREVNSTVTTAPNTESER